MLESTNFDGSRSKDDNFFFPTFAPDQLIQLTNTCDRLVLVSPNMAIILVESFFSWFLNFEQHGLGRIESDQTHWKLSDWVSGRQRISVVKRVVDFNDLAYRPRLPWIISVWVLFFLLGSRGLQSTILGGSFLIGFWLNYNGIRLLFII